MHPRLRPPTPKTPLQSRYRQLRQHLALFRASMCFSCLADLIQPHALQAPPCGALSDIITATPDPATFLEIGNFTEEPTPELLKECSASNSVDVLGGHALAAALKQPEPLVKVRGRLCNTYSVCG